MGGWMEEVEVLMAKNYDLGRWGNWTFFYNFPASFLFLASLKEGEKRLVNYTESWAINEGCP
jgi:hypothetical protein